MNGGQFIASYWESVRSRSSCLFYSWTYSPMRRNPNPSRFWKWQNPANFVYLAGFCQTHEVGSRTRLWLWQTSPWNSWKTYWDPKKWQPYTSLAELCQFYNFGRILPSSWLRQPYTNLAMFLNLYHSLSLPLFYLLGVVIHLKSGLDSLNLKQFAHALHAWSPNKTTR